ncbi:PA2c domain-containing protein [Meloidogyne graminicola]|uniref:Phospholipase A2 n=1 Tax=Meloidogyne graminicola TaxID=189291 RepID=A0A8S9ZGM5_9BILA|nr:PA2c domain-containing protein [Meloidogyne graminicola]
MEIIKRENEEIKKIKNKIKEYNNYVNKMKELILTTTPSPDDSICPLDPSYYNNYGCYCGIGNSGTPFDEIDSCCQIHDTCYFNTNKLKECPIINIFNTSILNNINYDLSCNDEGNTQLNCEGLNNNKCKKELCECDKALIECLEEYDIPNYNLPKIPDFPHYLNIQKPFPCLEKFVEFADVHVVEALNLFKLTINNLTTKVDIFKELENDITNNVEVDWDNYKEIIKEFYKDIIKVNEMIVLVAKKIEDVYNRGINYATNNLNTKVEKDNAIKKAAINKLMALQLLKEEGKRYIKLLEVFKQISDIINQYKPD